MDAWTIRLGLGRLWAHRRLVTRLGLRIRVRLLRAALCLVRLVSRECIVLIILCCLLQFIVMPMATLLMLWAVVLVLPRVAVALIGSRLKVFIGRTRYLWAVVRLRMALATTLRSRLSLRVGWARPLADKSYSAIILMPMLLY